MHWTDALMHNATRDSRMHWTDALMHWATRASRMHWTDALMHWATRDSRMHCTDVGVWSSWDGVERGAASSCGRNNVAPVWIKIFSSVLFY